MHLRPLSIVAAFGLALSLGCGLGASEDAPNKDEASDKADADNSGKDDGAGEASSSDSSWQDGLPESKHVDVATDETLESIFDYLNELTSEQKHDLAEMFIGLRDAQYKVMSDYDSGKGGKMGGKAGGKSGGKSGGKAGGKAGKGGKAGGGYPTTVFRAVDQLNQTFLTDGKKLMRSDQTDSWNDCAALIDLNPPELDKSSGGKQTGGPEEGKAAPEFSLKTMDGKSFSLSDLQGKPTIVQFGSYTCPAFRKEAPKLETLERQYGDDINWVLIYGYEAHASDGSRVSDENIREGIDYPTHKTYEDRVEMAGVAKDKLDLDYLIVVDDMKDTVTNGWDGHPNRAFILDASGKVVDKQQRIIASNVATTLDELL